MFYLGLLIGLAIGAALTVYLVLVWLPRWPEPQGSGPLHSAN